MASRRRHHYVPRFLLRRFASRGTKRKHWVWLYRRGAEPVEVSTNDTAVSRDFYGDPDESLEDDFAVWESKFAAELSTAVAERDLSGLESDLDRFVAILALRTRTVRSGISGGLNALLGDLATKVDHGERISLFDRYSDVELDDLIQRTILQLPLAQRLAVALAFEDPEVRARLRHSIREQMRSPEARALFSAVLHNLMQSTELATGIRASHNRTLHQLLADSSATTMLRDATWTLHRAGDTPLVLGDCVVVAVDGNGQTGSLIQLNQTWREVYLPVSSAAVCVASRKVGTPSLDSKQINEAMAAHSSDAFFASKRTNAVETLHCRVGLRSPLLSQEEVSQIAAKVASGR